MIDKKIHVAIVSYKRAGKVTTLDRVPFAWIWVPSSQAKEYRAVYGKRVIEIPDALDGNPARKRNAVLDRSPCPWTLILDDDITKLSYFEATEYRILNGPRLPAMIEHHFDLAEQLGARLWGINQNSDGMGYRPWCPFNLLSPVLGPFTGHLKPDLRYDESVPAKEDYDFFLQNIRKYRVVLRANRYHYWHGHGDNKGGFVSLRTMDLERRCVARMRQKWGDQVFKSGGSAGANRDRKTNPEGNILNCRINVPLEGC